MIFRHITTLLLLALTLSAQGAEKLRVSTFSTVLTEIAERVGGDAVVVTGHVRKGVDPHDFQPKASDLKAVASADVVLLSAKHMEGYVPKLRESSGGRAKFVEVGNQLPVLKMEHDHAAHDHSHDHHHHDEDPHWWHSVSNTIKAAKIVRDAFAELRPEEKATFAANTGRYLGELNALQSWVKNKVAELPRNQRKLVTSHDAFGWLAKEHGFRVLPIAGFSPSDKPSSKKVAEIIAEIKASGVKAVFTENIENPKVVAEITKETGAKFGGELFSDGLGEGEAGTYSGMMKHNVNAIVGGLK